jgi:NADPH:quinone reductase-like Zn-dependent oxidoreductase
MKVVEVRDSFGLDHLVTAERPDPVPGPGQIVVRMAAVSLNYRDLLMVQGFYNPRQALPFIPLSDGVGRVTAIGAGVRRVKVGERVAACFFQRWTCGAPTKEALREALGGPLDGTLCEQMLLPEGGVVRVPEHLGDEEAAALPCAGLTAWSALFEEGRVRAGDTVLVQGTGGVSLFALQLAKMAGARVIVTSSSDEKLELARALGADELVNYRQTPDWGRRAVELTGGTGVDHVVEVGGAGTIEQSLQAVRVGGTISVIGNLAGNEKELSLVRILMRKIRLQGVLVGHREAFEAMMRAVAQTKLRPVIDRTFEFAEARAAFAAMAEEKHFGKICIRMA